MSAYGHQIEREFSAQSLSSRGGSELGALGSHYVADSGFSMTSFTATIFIAALVTIGVLMTTLLVALTAMLQSCETRSKGVVEVTNPTSNYEYCQIFSLHAELNGLGLHEYPSICRSSSRKQMTDVQYVKDLTMSLSMVENYFESISPEGDGLDVILLDIDDIVTPFNNDNYPSLSRSDKYNSSNHCEGTNHVTQTFLLRTYMKLRTSGWSLILISRKSNEHRPATVDLLISAGYKDWCSIIMRLDTDMQRDTYEYFSRRSLVLQKQGFRISGVISSQMDALMWPSSPQGRKFKLPNPKQYDLKQNMYIAT